MNVNTTKNIKSAQDSVDKSVKAVGKAIANEPWEEVLLPDFNGRGEPVECCLNGYNYIIKRGERVKIPRPIVALLKNAGIL